MAFAQAIQALAIEAIGQRLRAVTGSRSSLEDFEGPPGDPGLFGPGSIAWRVHAHFTAMMVGGLSSLMVQALHPRALAAVWDHSNFRHNLRGRLGRTTSWPPPPMAAETWPCAPLSVSTTSMRTPQVQT